jgi:ABC-type xylose transport system permease subunit
VAVRTQSLGDLSLSGRRALLAVLAALTLYTLLDLLIGVRFSSEDALLIVSDVIALALQTLLVLFVWQRRRWAWLVGAIWAVLSAIAAVAMIADPVGIGGYDQDVSRAFVLLQGLLLIAAAGFWFAPGVRPLERRRSTAAEADPA